MPWLCYRNIKDSFLKESSWRAKEPLELVHSDVCDLMQVPTMSGNRYFLTFIDECSRMCWIYLRNKSDVFYLQEIQGHGGITKWLLSEKAEDR